MKGQHCQNTSVGWLRELEPDLLIFWRLSKGPTCANYQFCCCQHYKIEAGNTDKNINEPFIICHERNIYIRIPNISIFSKLPLIFSGFVSTKESTMSGNPEGPPPKRPRQCQKAIDKLKEIVGVFDFNTSTKQEALTPD